MNDYPGRRVTETVAARERHVDASLATLDKRLSALEGVVTELQGRTERVRLQTPVPPPLIQKDAPALPALCHEINAMSDRVQAAVDQIHQILQELEV